MCILIVLNFHSKNHATRHNLILGSPKLSFSFKKTKINENKSTWQELTEKGCRHMEKLNFDYGQNWKPDCSQNQKTI
jgi:hypothetical protein